MFPYSVSQFYNFKKSEFKKSQSIYSSQNIFFLWKIFFENFFCWNEKFLSEGRVTSKILLDIFRNLFRWIDYDYR